MPFVTQVVPVPPPGTPPQSFSVGLANELNAGLQNEWQLQHTLAIPAELPILAFPVEVAGYAFVLWLTHVWMRDIGGERWAERFPVFFFGRDEIDPTSHDGRIYQRWTLFLFLLLPLFLMAHMFVKFTDATVYFHPSGCTEQIGKPCTEAIKIVHEEHFATSRWWSTYLSPVGLCHFGSENGPQYYLLQPWVYLLALIAIVLCAFRTGWNLFRRREEQ